MRLISAWHQFDLRLTLNHLMELGPVHHVTDADSLQDVAHFCLHSYDNSILSFEQKYPG